MEPASATSCSVCGEPLGAKRTCFACLLRAGLDETEEPDSPKAATLFDDFEIARRDDGSLWELGRGAMGVTYLATEKPLHRSVALKVIELHGSEATRERFLREARAAAALRHPNVAGVFRFGAMADSDRCYCAMELVEGETLEALVRREGSLKLETALEIAIQITRALIAAAERQLVHRDLKPGNIMLTPSENSPAKVEVKVIDFGLAKAASTAGEMELTHGEFVGTPAFASPEQFAGGAIDARTDIYALGVTLWFALTGRLPFAGRTIEEIRQRQTEDKLPVQQLERLPRRVIELLRSCLSMNPAERPSSARALLKALESCQAESGKRRRKAKVALVAGLVLLAAGFAFFFLNNRSRHYAAPKAVPEKSIAVLPFENRSHDADNAYFADAIQDEILTRLSKIADLKVISRTSTENYKSAPTNLPEIARQLGVAHIVEGSVQKNGDTVRVNVQLIKAANDAHVWADTFDRKLTDVLSVESEVAKSIADQLRAKLTGPEALVVGARPTNNAEAYDNYLRGLAYTLKTGNNSANALGAQKYLREAVRLDPKFALAWALLSYSDAVGYRSLNLQPTPALREEARQAAETALTLQPNLGEAVLAKGYYHYSCLNEYDIAQRYFEQARTLLPNSSRIPESLAYLERRRGQWDRSESHFNDAERLDPRNVNLLTQHALLYMLLRRGPEALRKLDQVLNITPDDMDTLALQAAIAQGQGDLPRAAALLAPLHPGADSATVLETQVYQAILERRPAPIIPRLQEILSKPDPALGYINGELRFWLGWAQDVGGDRAAAQESWRQARGELEPLLKEQPDNAQLISDLALINMGLGDKAAALDFAERAMAELPLEKDAVGGPGPIEILARVAAQTGETDRAIAALRKLLAIPAITDTSAPFTPALLRLDPMFDPLRNDARFIKILAAEEALAQSSAGAMPAKSIAVLPFENLSRDPDNAFFTDGVQDEILTDLARVADLKVISRTSVMQYKDRAQRNLRQIAKDLGVAHVVEGSVQRSGNRVRVNAQLIDASTDAHLWAQTYDRDLADVFAIQSEIAKAIADQLQAKLSPNEKSEIEQAPTRDVTAFDFYSHAKNLFLNASGSSTGKADLLQAGDLLNQAIARDSAFFEAYCLLAFTEVSVYFLDFDHTPSRLAAAEAAVQTAARLRPEAGETHLARARNLYWGYNDYDGALAELEIARQRLPSDNWVFSLKGYIERRQGRWEESLRDLDRAVALDPRNLQTLQQTARSYSLLHRYAESKALLARVLSFEPNDAVTRVLHAWVELDSNANAQPVLEVIDSIRRSNPAAITNVANNWLICSLAQRDVAAAEQALASCGENPILLGTNENVIFPRPFVEGLIARMKHDEDKARVDFASARLEQEKVVQARPKFGPALAVLGLIDACLGKKEEALREGRRALELAQAEKDVVLGPITTKYLAIIATSVGETDLACEQLARLVREPSNVTYGQLKLIPFWDPLRGDPRFEKIMASLAPK